MFFDNTLNKNTANGRYTIYLSIFNGKKDKIIESSSDRKSNAIDS
jgi:hypothetical protein